MDWWRNCDAEHPTDITMSRVRLASDTCDIYFTYTKVNHLLYTCSLDPFEDGILLDTPLVCMHRYCRSFTDNELECKCQGTTTPSAREAWKRRRKKTELLKLQRPDIWARGRTSGAWTAAQELPQQTAKSISGRTSGASPDIRRLSNSRTSGSHPRKSGLRLSREEQNGLFQAGHPASAPDIRRLANGRTSGPQTGHPAPACAQSRARSPCIPFPLTLSWLRL
jgi:hypothetical protein